jgi:hypothetical protein
MICSIVTLLLVFVEEAVGVMATLLENCSSEVASDDTDDVDMVESLRSFIP